MPNFGYAENELQAAIFTALSTDTGISALAATVTDWVSEQTAFPYITIGSNTALDFDTQTSNGQEHTVTIHSWSRANGFKQVKQMMSRVYRNLHGAVLSMPNQRMVRCRCEYTDSSLDPDGVTYHGVQRFRIITQGV